MSNPKSLLIHSLYSQLHGLHKTIWKETITTSLLTSRDSYVNNSKIETHVILTFSRFKLGLQRWITCLLFLYVRSGINRLTDTISLHFLHSVTIDLCM